MKIDSVCKLWRSFLHFQKFVTRVLWIFMYVVKYMSSLELPLFLLSYLGRSLKHSGSSPWCLTVQVQCGFSTGSPIVKEATVGQGNTGVSNGILSHFLSFDWSSILDQAESGQKGTAKKHIWLKVPWEDEYSSRRLVSDGCLGRRTVCRSFITMCSLLPCKHISAVCSLGQVS